MARRKERIMAFDTLCPDTLHNSSERVCRNFVCFESKVRQCLESEDRKESWKQDPGRKREFDTITGYQTDARGGIGNLGTNLVCLTQAVLEKTVKASTPYIYKVTDYTTAKTQEIFCTRKDALDIIQKKIKSKNAVMHYNGNVERGEVDIPHINSLLSTLEPDTVDFDICSVGRNNTEGEMILLTIYKNCMSI